MLMYRCTRAAWGAGGLVGPDWAELDMRLKERAWDGVDHTAGTWGCLAPHDTVTVELGGFVLACWEDWPAPGHAGLGKGFRWASPCSSLPGLGEQQAVPPTPTPTPRRQLCVSR